MKFRHDINGLRAIAVIIVTIFHFKPNWLPGGFVGVDIFFVISGYLMTSILSRSLQQNTFSLLSFYTARVNRIIPALAFLCGVLLLLGLALIPLDYAILGRHVAASVGFISNFTYLSEAGYFETSSHEKWLLHTWSLAVEWQFYMVYPLIMMVLYRFFKLVHIKWLIVLATLLSFLVSAFASYKYVDAAYFLLPFRMWQMLLGGVAALMPVALIGRRAQICEYVGLLLIALSCVIADAQNKWPGFLALMPTLGTYLVIQAQRNASCFTNNTIFSALGAWSYSLYLWHWPLVVFPLYFALPMSTDYWFLFGIPCSLLFAWFSYTFIEKIQFPKQLRWRDLWRSKPLWMALLIACAGVLVESTFGFSQRFSSSYVQQNMMAKDAQGDWDFPDERNLTINTVPMHFMQGSSERHVLFLGGSHIQQTYPYVLDRHADTNVYFLTRAACMPIPAYVNPNWSCEDVQNYAKVFEKVRFDQVVLSTYLLDWYLPEAPDERQQAIDERAQQMDELLAFLKPRVQQVYLMLGEPQGRAFDPMQSLRYSLEQEVPVEAIRASYAVHTQVLQQLKNTDGVIIIDPVQELCDKSCAVMDAKNGYFYKDKDHMRPWYARQSLEYLQPILTTRNP